MNIDNRAGRIVFLIVGLLFFLYAILMVFTDLSSNTFSEQTVILFSLSIMAFCLSYLYPQFKNSDKRTKKIREKGMGFSFLMVVGYMFIFLLITQFNIFMFSAYEVVSVLLSLSMITIFISFVILSRRY